MSMLGYNYNLMNSQSTGEISLQQLKTRELAQQYLKIQENTQFLTNVIRYQPLKKRIQMRAQLGIPDFKSIASLTVQLSYFLFTCNIKQTNVFISKKIYYLNPNKRQPNPQICCEYILQKDLLKLTPQHQKLISNHFTGHQFSTNQTRSYGQYTLQYIKKMLDLIKSNADKAKTPIDKMLIKQFQKMDQIVRNYIQPKIQTLQHARIVILALEQTELFREHSILVKVMNNSIFSAIRNSKYKNVFQEISRMQGNLLQIKVTKNQIQTNAKEMQSSIESLLRFLIKSQIITVQQSINDVNKSEVKNQPQNNTNSKPYVLGQVDGNNASDRKYLCRIQVVEKPIRQFNSKLYDAIVFQAMNSYTFEDQANQSKSNDPKSFSKNQYLIEYMSGKGIISVKYITGIELNIENTDLIMFQCNSIAFHWSNVSMELVQKSPNKGGKKKQRFLAFKTLSHLHVSQSPLFKLLIMLDLVMLCAKIAEPQLRKPIVRSQDYNKIEEITLKVDHMIKLFIKKIERYYKMISQSGLNKGNMHQ